MSNDRVQSAAPCQVATRTVSPPFATLGGMSFRPLILLALVGCSDGPIMCESGEGPSMQTISFVTFSAAQLTCIDNVEVQGCTGECCQPRTLSSTTTPVACTDDCATRGEASCLADANCAIARDATSDSFIGCYAEGVASPLACADRAVDSCFDFAVCLGLYTTAPLTFVACADKR